MTKATRAITLVVGGAMFVAWFVSLAVRASIGATDTVSPRLTAMGGVPAAPPTLAPLVLPRRDPFAADQIGVASVGLGRGSVASMQVPDPSVFAKNAGASNLGVIGVIVGDQDSYALVEDGPQIQVVHVNDAFAGTTVTAITPHGVVLANGITLDVDAVRPSSPGAAVSNGGTPSPSPLPGHGMIGGDAGSGTPQTQTYGTPGTGGQQTITGGPLYPPGSVVAPGGYTTLGPSGGATIPGPLSGNSSTGSLFPLLSPPSPSGVPH